MWSNANVNSLRITVQISYGNEVAIVVHKVDCVFFYVETVAIDVEAVFLVSFKIRSICRDTGKEYQNGYNKSAHQ